VVTCGQTPANANQGGQKCALHHRNSATVWQHLEVPELFTEELRRSFRQFRAA
jgi:hypothetical protein